MVAVIRRCNEATILQAIVDIHIKSYSFFGCSSTSQHLRRAANLNHTRNNQTGIKNGLYRGGGGGRRTVVAIDAPSIY